MRAMYWTNVLLAAILSLTAGSGVHARDYPPAGSPDPGSPCAREGISQSMRFFCDFITLERWLAAGRPDFVDASGKRWQPWYYGKDGLTNQLLIEGRPYRPSREGWLEALFDVEAFEAEDYSYFWDLFRYTPWSVQVHHAYRCGERQMVNPGALHDGRIRREHLLALGWEGADTDRTDPTAGFDAGAMLVLETLASLDVALDPEQRARLGEGHTAHDEVNAMAEGGGMFWPDFDRDAEVWLVRPQGEPERLDDLDEAATRLAETGRLVTNDAIGKWKDGYALALRTARDRGPLVYIYFAQDAFGPRGAQGVYRQRLGYLIDRVETVARDRGTPVRVISHGRSAGIVADAVAGRDAVIHEAVAPAPGPWDVEAYDAALAQDRRQTRIEVTELDFMSPLGYGADFPERPLACLGPQRP